MLAFGPGKRLGSERPGQPCCECADTKEKKPDTSVVHGEYGLKGVEILRGIALTQVKLTPGRRITSLPWRSAMALTVSDGWHLPIFPKVVPPAELSNSRTPLLAVPPGRCATFREAFRHLPTCRSVGGQTRVTVGRNSAIAEHHFRQCRQAAAPPFGKLFHLPIFPKVVPPAELSSSRISLIAVPPCRCATFREAFRHLPICRSVGGQTRVTVGRNSAIAEPHLRQCLQAAALPFGKLFVTSPSADLSGDRPG